MDVSIADALTRAIGTTVHGASFEAIGGGSIHAAYRARTDDGFVFVKVGSSAVAAMFTAEALGLNALDAANCIRVPRVLARGEQDGHAFLCLEWLDLRRPTAGAETRLGEQLAALHRVCGDRFGFASDNFIGATPQRNGRCDSWTRFFREQRLGPQLELAREHGADARVIERGYRLLGSLDAFFDHAPAPSLLHGDLWGGNWGAATSDDPVIFDPAVYYGDRETDLAMTRLFGGFGRKFYAAYASAWPLAAGAEVRATLYNLYHVLNHFNLFGGAYLAQARSMIEKLLAEVRS